MNNIIPVVKTHPDAIIPERKTLGSVGYDLYSIDDKYLSPGERKWINTGISLALPFGYYGKIEARSSHAEMGLDLGAGVIDSDYRGEIRVLLINNIIPSHTQNSIFRIKKGMRIAQLIILKYETVVFEEAKIGELSKTERGDKGFGSTGLY